MNATINTDASYSHKYKVGAFAFWIVCDGGVRFFGSGPLSGTVDSPSVAELMCICKALVYLQNLQKNGTVKPITDIRINTDSLNSIHILNGDKPEIRRYGLDKGQYKTTTLSWLKVKRYDWKLSFKHVKSHVGTNTPSQYVNQWCDTQAKKFIQILITERESSIIK